APQGFFGEVNLWLDERMTERTARSGKTARAKT
ncbi:transcriptional regulator, partial [Serratia marcescens]